MTSTREPIDRAFSETSDPATYVPRAATESALEEILSWSSSSGPGSSVAFLVAPPGFGKTLLLRVIESKIANRSGSASRGSRMLHLPYASLSLTDLCLWVYGLLGIAPDFAVVEEEPRVALSALMALASGPEDPFFLVLDDADSMPVQTVRCLTQDLPSERSPLRILMAINDDARGSRLLAAFDPLQPLEVRLRKPMNEPETQNYLIARMRQAGMSASEIDRIDSAAIARIHRLSGGVPRRLHRIVASIFVSDSEGVPSELDEKQRREDWMGRPLEDDL